ncbi:hypothetical protein FJT64_007376 [Amphibalanus amphitrite]|uniref:Uncharacterized protein n=1 Tax=Amphibalanus amphitrite TaxID=1232801 RepID=A0A6A4VYS2_AMPAM|nr:hypothetical protein FJT64_007376 [Amphibalanus amphitrite]
MHLIVFAAAVAAAAAASTPAPDCHCDLALAHERPPLVIYELPGEWYGGCEPFLEIDCLQECTVRRDELESVGAWEADIGDGTTVGQVACATLGRDEPHGIHSVLAGALCGLPLASEGVGLREPLCCLDGNAVQC